MENSIVKVSDKADLTFTTPFGKVELNGETANFAVFCGFLVCLAYFTAKAVK
ncbi:MAG: hypothetical protein MUC49_14845 [Raineya sp.]|jgi:hypothetical protein|nr:hypothetical protein [Raineya sp.]